MKQRATEPEWMDAWSEHGTLEDYHDVLRQLGRVGQLLGSDRATFKALRQLKKPPASILDVGCGGGAFTVRLSMEYPKARVVGIDTSAEAIRYAKERQPRTFTKVSFEHRENPVLNEPAKSYDVVTSTLLCHHLSDAALIEFLQRAKTIASEAILLNDLHRYPAASFLYAILAPLLFRNRIITHDGLLSIRKAFKRKDWIEILNAAGFSKDSYSITWHWPFRWIVVITTT